MDKKTPPSPTQPPSTIPTQWAILIAVLAFSAGAGISWLFLHDQSSKTAAQQPPTYVTQPAGSESGNVGSLPPDISQLPPAQAAVTLGNWNYDRRDWPKAIESYQRAIALGLDNADVRTDLGNAFRFSGEPQKALEQYQTARRENPLHENSLFNMATLYAQVLNDPVNAASASREYLRLFPNGDKAAAARQFVAAQTLTGTSSLPPK